MNITDEGRRKGHEALKRNIAMIPTGGIRDPEKANAAFESALKGRCFCPRKGHNSNCKSSIAMAAATAYHPGEYVPPFTW